MVIEKNAVPGTEDDYPTTWCSADPRIAVVNSGYVTAVAKGSTKVTAYIGGKAYSATVKVTDTCSTPARFKKAGAEFAMNPLQSFNVRFDSSVLKISKAEWSGDGMRKITNSKGNVTGYENSVIRISPSGKFTAIGPGKTTVTGKDSSSGIVTVTVNVVPVSTKEAVYITKGRSQTIRFPKVTNKKADWWKSSSDNTAKVDTVPKNAGRVTGIGYGSAKISCSYNGFIFNTTAYVEEPEMIFAGSAIKNNGQTQMNAGQMKQLKLNRVYQTLNYKSSKPSVAFIDENGFIYARNPGRAVISSKINGQTFRFTVEVK